ncbi:hypothetical protein SLEP1_g53416 [Rubroshorea leprosula]|uniref:Retrotransposon gag domain-containing protein n=1 Tax=Rubroshorea leprosula TaxID=152421 RepID=A0AAV5MCW0_9ROSI|nr:hypothetical protein SLEP1_g53416 [Rubroshorea leprosula]
MVGTSQPHEVHTMATDGNGGSTVGLNNSAPPIVATTSIDRASPNAADSTQGYYDGRKGSAVENVRKFLDAMGAHADDKDLCLREFSKSLSDRSYTWYITLPSSSVHSWDEMVEQFCQKYFQSEERIAILDLHNTCQYTSEDLMVYMKRFRDLALDCYGGHVESFIVEICINNMFREYRVVLENIGINQFVRRQRVDKDPLPHHNQGVVNVLTHVQSIGASEPIVEFPNDTPNFFVCALQRTPKFKMLFNQLGFAIEARRRATEAYSPSLMRLEENASTLKCMLVAHASRTYLESSNVVTFIDEDMEAPHLNHRKPLYLSAQINFVGVRRALVDMRSSLNLIPLSTIIAARIP